MDTVQPAAFGAAGMLTVFVKAILCNRMVCMGVLIGLCSTCVIGRIATAWMPILVFFAQRFEPSLVNMFVIPAGMMMGARPSVVDWIVGNLTPVTLGNLVAGCSLAALALSATFTPARAGAALVSALPQAAE